MMRLILPLAVGVLATVSADEDFGSYRYSLNKPNFSYWNDTNDDILTEFKTLMTVAERTGKYDREQGSNLRTLQRFAELVDMIMYLQQVPFFGQYWYYGCWCAPEGFLKTIGRGYGQPVDQIDRSCRSMAECYECAQMDFGTECSTTNVNYRWRGIREEVERDGKNYIERSVLCEDPVGSCSHSICSCDKKLAEDLALYEQHWDLHKHQKWGDFNRELECTIQTDRLGSVWLDKRTEHEANTETLRKENSPSGGFKAISEAGPSQSSSSDWTPIGERALLQEDQSELALPSFVNLKSAGEFGHLSVKACCGSYPTRFPYKLESSHKCCNNILYNHSNQQCCADGSLVSSAHGETC